MARMRQGGGGVTWHDGDRLEGPEDPEGAQAGQVAELDEGGEVAGEDDDEVEPVPRVPQVGVVVEDEPLGDHLDHHLHRVDGQEDDPARISLKSVDLFVLEMFGSISTCVIVSGCQMSLIYNGFPFELSILT